MADKKISQLTAASTPLAGTEVLPIVQSGSTVKVASNDLTVKNVRSNATTGILQVAGPGAGATRVMTTPDANFTAARTDAAQTFTGVQTFSSDAAISGLTVGKGPGAVASNTAIGADALKVNEAGGENNTAIGYQALDANTTGDSNTAVGSGALGAVSTASENTAVGHSAGAANSGGQLNAYFGKSAGANVTTGNANCLIGNGAGSLVTTGSGVTAVGYATISGNTSTASNNTAVGCYALRANSTGTMNTALGGGEYGSDYGALGYNTTGSYNTAVGHFALQQNVGASNNTAIGYAAGDTLTSGGNNTLVGHGTDASANNGDSQTVVGQGLTGKGNDTAFIGGTNGAYNEKNVTTWETTSDQRIKKNIADNAVGLEKIKQIRVRNFEYRKPEEITELPKHAAIDKDGVQLGVIAQEIRQVLPECVTENSTGVLSVSTDPLVWYLINAVKELSAQVEELKNKV